MGRKRTGGEASGGIDKLNAANQEFYRTIFFSDAGLQPYTESSKMTSCDDFHTLEQNGLLPKEKDAKIAVLGFGEGRDVDYLLKAGYSNLTAVEVDPNAVAKLKQKYVNNPVVTIIEADIQLYQPEEKFEYVFWVYCGFGDFSAEGQQRMIDKTMELLVPGGVAFVDNPGERETNATSTSKRFKYQGVPYTHDISIKGQEGEEIHYRGTVSSARRIRYWARESELVAETRVLQYFPEGDDNRQRSLFVFYRSKEDADVELQPAKGTTASL